METVRCRVRGREFGEVENQMVGGGEKILGDTAKTEDSLRGDHVTPDSGNGWQGWADKNKRIPRANILERKEQE